MTEAVTGGTTKSLKRLPGGSAAAFRGLTGQPSADFKPARPDGTGSWVKIIA